ncbi:MAG: response regulator [Deltaproteobacteria bacterium]|nr:response regulator [Deltaproteobacteria bacterium]
MAAKDSTKSAKPRATKTSVKKKPKKVASKASSKPKKVASSRPVRADGVPSSEPVLGSLGIRLLVVDDEVEVLELLVPFLRKRGYVVSQAEDGDQALEKILTERPNIVLLDVMMPGLNGWEISQYVRDRPELDPVRIIMATGIGEEMNAATAPLYGADAYIDKPFRLDEVEKAIADVVGRIVSGAI